MLENDINWFGGEKIKQTEEPDWSSYTKVIEIQYKSKGQHKNKLPLPAPVPPPPQLCTEEVKRK